MEWYACACQVVVALDDKPVILAGNIQRSLPHATAETVSQQHEDGVFISDPWGSWLKNQGSSTGSQANAAAKLPGPIAQPPRKIEAPIEDKFQRQEEQIHQRRTSAEKEILSFRANMSKLEQALEQTKRCH